MFRLDVQTWRSDLMFRLDVQTWCSDLMFRLGVQTWCSDLMCRLEFHAWEERVGDYGMSATPSHLHLSERCSFLCPIKVIDSALPVPWSWLLWSMRPWTPWAARSGITRRAQKDWRHWEALDCPGTSHMLPASDGCEKHDDALGCASVRPAVRKPWSHCFNLAISTSGWPTCPFEIQREGAIRSQNRWHCDWTSAWLLECHQTRLFQGYHEYRTGYENCIWVCLPSVLPRRPLGSQEGISILAR